MINLERYWLPDIVHLHLTALEAGWLLAVVQQHKHNFAVNIPDVNGDPVPSTMSEALVAKLEKAWESHD